MKLFIRDKVYFTDPITGEIIEDTVTHLEDNIVIGKSYDLTDYYNSGQLEVHRIHCHVCGDMLPIPLSYFQVDGLRGKYNLLPSSCKECLNKTRYPDNPEEGVTLWI